MREAAQANHPLGVYTPGRFPLQHLCQVCGLEGGLSGQGQNPSPNPS